MRKRFFSIALSLCLCISTMPLTASAEESALTVSSGDAWSVVNEEVQQQVSAGDIVEGVSDEEMEAIEAEIALMLSSVESGDGYELTEEQLCLLAPKYLYNDAYDDIFARCIGMSREAMNSVSTTDEALAGYMYCLKNGAALIWNEIWASCGMADSTFSTFQSEAAKEVMLEYLNANDNLVKTSEKVAGSFGLIDTAYDLTTTSGKESFAKKLKTNNLLLSESEADEIVDSLFENVDTIMKYAGETEELFMLSMSLVEMQMIELQALDDLIVVHNQIKGTAMRDALVELRYEITTDIGTYFVTNYLQDKVLKLIQDEMDTALGNLTEKIFGFSDFSVALGKFTVKVVADIYESVKPSVSDIVYSQLLYTYWQNSESAVNHYKNKFLTGEGTAEDIRLLETAINFNSACTKMLLSKSKELVKNSVQGLYQRMECWESSMASEINYDLYINSCLNNADKAIEAGTLVIEDDSAIVKDSNGTVIDDSYNSTETIKARFETIQSQFVPNIGQMWNEDWNGAIQCFGFARMVFYYLFDCNMPAQYVGGAKYKFATEDNVVLVGQLVGEEVSASTAKTMLQQGKLGDIIQASGATYGQHTMVFVSADDNGVTVYDCNAHLDASEPDCVIHQWTIGWDTWASWYGTGSANDVNGISLYRAGNYAKVYDDGEEIFYDDSVNFVIEEGVLVEYTGWQYVVDIPDTVTVIGDSAFENNTSMRYVNIPEGVISIGDDAFYGCTSLLGVVLPDSVTELGDYSFYGCGKLENINVSNNLQTIGKWCFGECLSLRSLKIPDNITQIEEGTFYRCKSLTEIQFPIVLTDIGDSAFKYCTELEELDLSEIVSDNVYFNIGDYAFEECEKLKSVIFPKHIPRMSVGGGAFKNCDLIQSITVSTNFWSIGGAFGAGPFDDCTGLKTVIFEKDVNKIASCLFSGCDGLESIVIPDKVTEIGSGAFYECSNLKDIELSENVRIIGNGAFGYCTSLENIELPNSVSCIENGAFYGCTALQEIELSNTVKNIQGYVFADCTSLKNVKLPENIEELSDAIFLNCDSLETVTIPESLTRIGWRAFHDCDALVDIEIPDSVTKIDTIAFRDCDALKKIKIPNSVTTMGGAVFADCDELTTVTIGKGLKYIPTETFSGCKKLSSISIPHNVNKIEDNAFRECSSLVTVIISQKTTYISGIAFPYLDGVTFYGVSGSYAETYASEYGMNFVPHVIAAEQIVLPNTCIVNKGSTLMLIPEVIPENYTELITWESTDMSVATVNEYGEIQGISEGNVTIIAKVGNLSAQTMVSVVQPVTQINISKSSLKLYAADTYQLTATVYPENVYNNSVRWTSSDNSIAIVLDNGVVIPMSKGECEIIATAVDGSGTNACCEVDVASDIWRVRNVEGLRSHYSQESSFNGWRDAWQYTMEGAKCLKVTFSSDTCIKKYDSIYVLDSNNEQVGKYSGNELSGKTVYILGDTVRIYLEASVTEEYSFRVSNIEAVEPTVYTIIYDKNNPNATGNMTNQNIIFESKNMLAENKYKCTGYTFAGWNTQPNGTGTAYANQADGSTLTSTPGATINLYAQWTPVNYTISYNLNGGKNSSNPTTYTIATATIPLTNPSKTGYTFGGWYSDSKLTNKVTTISQGSTGNKTLYAKWTANTYKVKFNSNGGKGKMTTLTSVTYGKSYKLKKNTFTKKGYTFAGWNTKKNGKGTTYKNKASIKNLTPTNKKTVTLYAQWKPVNYKITYNLNGGKNSTKNPKKYTVATKTITLKKPTKKGYTFAGWYSDKKLTKKVTKIKKGTTGNIKLYAKWVKK